MERPKFSIITCVFNTGKFIDACIQSVLNQSYTNWEMIILNDASTDYTPRLLTKYARNSKIKVITNPKRTFCGSAYAKVAKGVTGDLVGVLDSDDALDVTAMHRIATLYEEYPDIDFIYTQHWECKSRSPRDLRPVKKGVSGMPKPGMSILETWEQRKGHCFSHWRTCRASMLKHGIFPEGHKFGVDKYMGMVLESYGQGGFYDKPLYLYRNHNQQMTRIMRGERMKQKKILISKVRKIRKKFGLTPLPIKEIPVT